MNEINPEETLFASNPYMDSTAMDETYEVHFAAWITVMLVVFSGGLLGALLSRYCISIVPPEDQNRSEEYTQPPIPKTVNFLIKCHSDGTLSRSGTGASSAREYSSVVTVLRDENAALKQKLTDAQHIINTSTDQGMQALNTINSKFRDSEAECNLLRRRIEEEQSRTNGWKKVSQEEREARDLLEQEVRDFEIDRGSAARERDDAITERDDLRRDNFQLGAELKSLGEQLDQALKQCADDQAATESSKQARQMAEEIVMDKSKLSDRLEQQVKYQQEIIDALRRGLHEKVESAQLRQQEKGRKEIADLRADNKRIVQELTQARGDATGQAKRNGELQKELTEARNEAIEQSQLLQKERATEKGKQQSADGEISGLKEQVERLTVEINKITGLEKRVTLLRQQRDIARDEVRSGVERITELESQLKSSPDDDSSVKLKDAQTEIHELKKENEQLRSHEMDLKVEISDLESLLAESEEKTRAAETRESKLAGDLANHRKKLEGVQAELEKHKKKAETTGASSRAPVGRRSAPSPLTPFRNSPGRGASSPAVQRGNTGPTTPSSSKAPLPSISNVSNDGNKKREGGELPRPGQKDDVPPARPSSSRPSGFTGPQSLSDASVKLAPETTKGTRLIAAARGAPKGRPSQQSPTRENWPPPTTGSQRSTTTKPPERQVKQESLGVSGASKPPAPKQKEERSESESGSGSGSEDEGRIKDDRPTKRSWNVKEQPAAGKKPPPQRRPPNPDLFSNQTAAFTSSSTGGIFESMRSKGLPGTQAAPTAIQQPFQQPQDGAATTGQYKLPIKFDPAAHLSAIDQSGTFGFSPSGSSQAVGRPSATGHVSSQQPRTGARTTGQHNLPIKFDPAAHLSAIDQSGTFGFAHLNPLQAPGPVLPQQPQAGLTTTGQAQSPTRSNLGSQTQDFNQSGAFKFTLPPELQAAGALPAAGPASDKLKTTGWNFANTSNARIEIFKNRSSAPSFGAPSASTDTEQPGSRALDRSSRLGQATTAIDAPQTVAPSLAVAPASTVTEPPNNKGPVRSSRGQETSAPAAAQDQHTTSAPPIHGPADLLSPTSPRESIDDDSLYNEPSNRGPLSLNANDLDSDDDPMTFIGTDNKTNKYQGYQPYQPGESDDEALQGHFEPGMHERPGAGAVEDELGGFSPLQSPLAAEPLGPTSPVWEPRQPASSAFPGFANTGPVKDDSAREPFGGFEQQRETAVQDSPKPDVGGESPVQPSSTGSRFAGSGRKPSWGGQSSERIKHATRPSGRDSNPNQTHADPSARSRERRGAFVPYREEDEIQRPHRGAEKGAGRRGSMDTMTGPGSQAGNDGHMEVDLPAQNPFGQGQMNAPAVNPFGQSQNQAPFINPFKQSQMNAPPVNPFLQSPNHAPVVNPFGQSQNRAPFINPFKQPQQPSASRARNPFSQQHTTRAPEPNSYPSRPHMHTNSANQGRALTVGWSEEEEPTAAPANDDGGDGMDVDTPEGEERTADMAPEEVEELTDLFTEGWDAIDDIDDNEDDPRLEDDYVAPEEKEYPGVKFKAQTPAKGDVDEDEDEEPVRTPGRMGTGLKNFLTKEAGEGTVRRAPRDKAAQKDYLDKMLGGYGDSD
ncbi:hypothetical protein PMIN04_012291 [Paraphaeosphaeria minitans]